jgi:hypothetical protein
MAGVETMSREDISACRIVLLASFVTASAAWEAARDSGDREASNACAGEMRRIYRELTEVEAALKAALGPQNATLRP